MLSWYGEQKKRRSYMKYRNNIRVLIVLYSLLYFTYPQAAYAYLDPGTGSYFFQILIGILLGALFALKLYWGKIRIFLRNLVVRRETHGKEEK